MSSNLFHGIPPFPHTSLFCSLPPSLSHLHSIRRKVEFELWKLNCWTGFQCMYCRWPVDNIYIGLWKKHSYTSVYKSTDLSLCTICIMIHVLCVFSITWQHSALMVFIVICEVLNGITAFAMKDEVLSKCFSAIVWVLIHNENSYAILQASLHTTG